jgi:hypothetical protein
MKSITHPKVILAEKLAAAIKPLAAELRKAAETDRELAHQAGLVHPDRGRERAMKLHDAAIAGNAEALAELENLGGLDRAAETFSASYRIREAVRNGFAERCAPLLARTAAALIPAVQAAEVEITAQFTAAMAHLGEIGDGSQWPRRLQILRDNLAALPTHAARGTGLAWQLEGLGLAEFFEG